MRWIFRLIPLVLIPFGMTVYFGCVDRLPENTDTPTKMKVVGTNSYQVITGDDTDEEREHWNQLFRSQPYVWGKEPVPFLRDHTRMLPHGRALVMPMEQGRNAVFLAESGFSVTGVDFSDVALQGAQRLAKERGVVITGVNADLNGYLIDGGSYDVIVDLDFYRPRLIAEIWKGLKPGGLLVFQAVMSDQAEPGKRTDTMITRAEIKELFKDFQILLYKEGVEEDKFMASMIAKKALN
jgi:SAM-dependent methyltransferase